MISVSSDEKRIKRIFNRVVGIDESGVCSYAGPIVVAGVILPNDIPCEVDDCKRLSEKQIEEISKLLLNSCEVEYIIISEKRCDCSFLKEEYKAIKQIMKALKPTFALIDYHSVPTKCHVPQWGYLGGDKHLWCVAAASVIAKSIHTQYMRRIDLLYPEYKWKDNKGSYNKQLFKLTLKYGLTRFHRPSWIKSTCLKKNIDFESLLRR